MKVVFDLGNVLVRWDPLAIVRSLAVPRATQDLIKRELFDHPDWLALDAGLTTEAAVIDRISREAGLPRDLLVETLKVTKAAFTDIPASVAVVRELAERGIPLYCLSNMSVDSYQVLRSRDYFQCFSGVVISGEEGLLKPDPRLFLRLFERFELEPVDLLFIDDVSENIEAAVALGMRSRQFSGSEADYRWIRQQTAA